VLLRDAMVRFRRYDAGIAQGHSSSRTGKTAAVQSSRAAYAPAPFRAGRWG
jgi:hypothetical protein